MNLQKSRDGICRLEQADGKTLAWHEDSGVTLLEEDGLYFKDLERSGSLLPYEDWRLSDRERAQDLDNILACREAMGDAPVIVCMRLNNPMVMSEFEPAADAIVAEFGVSKSAVLDILFGECDPSGRLPVQMPRDMDTVEAHAEDVAFDLVPYTDSQGNTYDYGFGLQFM